MSRFLPAAVSTINPNGVPERRETDLDQLRNYGDERQTGFCAYCGVTAPDTRDHVPSKVFLDEPYPPNLPIVPACRRCNEGFAQDEEYLTCLIECAIAGSTEPNDVKREKGRRILQTKPALAARLSAARQEMGSDVFFRAELSRVQNVATKLARGHACFELNEPQLDAPSSVSTVPLPSMSPVVRAAFETPPVALVCPEVGSRAMQRLAVGNLVAPPWTIVQPGRYRYLATVDDRVLVRIVIREYLACEVRWT